MKWFRLWTDILDDVKMLQLSDYEFRMWTYLMAIASEVDSMSGECQLNVKSMSLRCRTQVNHLSRAIETFQNSGLVTIDESGFIVITNWSKRQFRSDNAYERVKKHREVTIKRNVSCNVSETVPDTDTETDTDNTPIAPKKKGTDYTDDYLTFYFAYPRQEGKKDGFKAWQSLNGRRPPLDELLAKLKMFIEIRWAGTLTKYIPLPASWLRGERWSDEIDDYTGKETDISHWDRC